MTKAAAQVLLIVILPATFRAALQLENVCGRVLGVALISDFPIVSFSSWKWTLLLQFSFLLFPRTNYYFLITIIFTVIFFCDDTSR